MELEIDAEWNRIEAAGRVTSSVGEIRPRGGSSNSRRRSGIERRAKALLTGEEAVRPSLVVPTATSTPPRGGSSSSASSPMDRPCSSSVGSSAPPDQARKLSRRRSLRAACPRARSPACPPSGVVEVAGVEGVRESGGGERRSGWAEDPPGMRERGGLPHFAVAFAAAARAATLAPASAKPGCGTGCRDCWRQSLAF
jgi:hypothetical protein